jgi:hypothetical protein
MTILYDSAAPVKSRNFGLGLTPSAPHHFAPYTAADEQWYRDQLAIADENRRADAMAAESRLMDRLESGCFAL